MNIVFYIGHHKTGSSSLQRFLSINHKILLQHDILYPAVNNLGRMVYASTDSTGFLSGLTNRLNICEAHNGLAFKLISEKTGRNMPYWHRRLPSTDKMLNTIQYQIDKYQPNNLVFCSEVMGNLAIHSDILSRLVDRFNASKCCVYCTLRNPYSMLESWHGQRLKRGQNTGRLKEGATRKYLTSIFFNYRLMIEPWLNIANPDSYHVINYDNFTTGEDSISKFLQTVFDLDMDIFTKIANTNVSIPLAVYEIIHRSITRMTRDKQEELLNYILKYRQLYPADNQVELFGYSNRKLIFDEFKPINTYLGDITGIEDYFDGLEMHLTEKPVSEEKAFSDTLDIIKHQTPCNKNINKMISIIS